MSEQPSRGRFSFLSFRVRIISLILIASVLVIWNIFPPNVPRNPIVLAREVDGTLLEQQPDNGSGLTFNARLGGLKSQNQTSSSSSSGHSNPAFFAARRLIIMNQSNDVLMERVGTELVEALKNDFPVDRLEYYPHGHMPEPGKLSPDFYLTLGLKSKEVSGLLRNTLDATVTAHFGSSFSKSSHSTFDNRTPPLVRLQIDVEVKHHSTYTGVESSAAAYTLQGRDIAKQITAHLTKKIEDASEGHGPLPKMPAILSNPGYTPIPEFDFLNKLDAEVMTSTHRLMVHNETFWRLTTDMRADELFESIQQKITDKDWKIDRIETQFPRSAFLRAIRGPRVLMVFPADRDAMPRTSDLPQTGSVDYLVHYRHRITRESLQTAIAEMLEQPIPDANLLIAFRSRATSEQSSRIISLIEQQQPGTEAGWIALADHYSSRKDGDGCRRALRRLTCLEHLSTDAGSISRKIRDIAKKQKLDKSEYSHPTREDWLELGLVELVRDQPAESVEFGLDTQAGFFTTDTNGVPHIYSVRITLAGAGNPKVVRMHSSKGSRSWTSGSIFYSGLTTDHHRFGDGPDELHVETTIERLLDDRFRVTGTLKQ